MIENQEMNSGEPIAITDMLFVDMLAALDEYHCIDETVHLVLIGVH